MNPFQPSNSTDLGRFAQKYRVDQSKTTMREFRDLSGSRLLGPLYWLALQTGLVKMNAQVVDGPRPFAEDRCEPNEILEPVYSHFMKMIEDAKKLGFHSEYFSACKTNRPVVNGGTVRMLHQSKNSFLQIIASSTGEIFASYEIVVSASKTKPIAYASTNGAPNYNPVDSLKTFRHVDMPLDQLVETHAQSMDEIDDEFLTFESFDNVGLVLDHVANLYYQDKIDRKILVAESS